MCDTFYDMFLLRARRNETGNVSAPEITGREKKGTMQQKTADAWMLL